LKRTASVALVAALGALGVAASLTTSAGVATCGAVFVVLVLPGVALADALTAGDAHADAADALSASFGAVAVSASVLWITGATVGLTRATILGAPLGAAVLLAAVAPSTRQRGRLLPPPGFGLLLALAAGFAVLVAIPFYPYGLERSDGVRHMGLSDWYLHLMMTTTLDTTSSLPPRNPYLITQGGAYYHYGFHLLAAGIHRAAGRSIDIFPILLGLTMLTAAAYPLILFSVARRRLGGDSRKALAVAAGAALLAGFDLVVWVTDVAQTLVARWPPPGGVEGLRLVIPSAHLHSWIPVYERQFNAPYVALLWAPHYVAAVLISLLCIHVLRDEVTRPPYVAAALMLSALPGLSAYVALATAVCVAGIVLGDMWQTGSWKSPAGWRWGISGVAAAAIAAPSLLSLKGSVGQHVAPLVLHLSAVGSLHNGALFTSLFGDEQWTRLLDTPLLLVFQFGIIGTLGAAAVTRRIRERRWDNLALTHAVGATATLVFLILFRPPVGMDNNLGLRPMLLVWSLLAPFAGEAWFAPARFPLLRWVALVICAAALPYGLAGATLEGWLFRPVPTTLVAVARWINANVPPGSPVAVDPPDHPRGFDLFLRQPLVEAEHRRNALMMGASPEEFEAARASLHEAYTSLGGPAAAQRFRDLGAAVVVARTDPDGSLPWHDLPCYRQAYRRADLAVLVRATEACFLRAPSETEPR
jgi:hypothetical protein